jgi:hypothetical protein
MVELSFDNPELLSSDFRRKTYAHKWKLDDCAFGPPFHSMMTLEKIAF